jgi:hypothetical protein
MQYENLKNILPTIRWTFEASKMQEESEKFEERLSKEGNYKLIVDFNDLNLEFQSKQMEVENIKYKKKKTLKKEVVNLKEKKKDTDLF